MTENVQTIQLKLGDCIAVLAAMPENSLGAIICDPPYFLGFMGKEFDEQDGAHQNPVLMMERHGAWLKEAFRVLKPGGVLKAFSAPRTYHRLIRAMRKAGFVNISAKLWTYASGFPKALNVSRAIDAFIQTGRSDLSTEVSPDASDGPTDPKALLSEEAKRWEGWATSLKPAHEPILIAYKPGGAP